MQIKTLIILFLIGIGINISNIMADGWHTSSIKAMLEEPSQKAAIHWDGNTQQMLLSSYVKNDELSNFAWIIPIMSNSKPIIEEGDKNVFRELHYYINKKDPLEITASSNNLNSVKIIEKKEIGIYDILTIKTNNTKDLIQWLHENNYLFNNNSFEVLNSYVKNENCYFVINKIDLKNKFEKEINFINKLNEKYATILNKKLTVSEILDEEYYREDIESVNMKEDLKKYKEIIDQLNIGLATPIKITFNPNKPYFPLYISSLNKGSTNIKLFICSETPAITNNRLMNVNKIKFVDSKFKHKLIKYFKTEIINYVTEMSYSGPAKYFNDDVYFSFESKENYSHQSSKNESILKWQLDVIKLESSEIIDIKTSVFNKKPTVAVMHKSPNESVYKTSFYSLVDSSWKEILKENLFDKDNKRTYMLDNFEEVNGVPTLIYKTTNYIDLVKYYIYKFHNGVWEKPDTLFYNRTQKYYPEKIMANKNNCYSYDILNKGGNSNLSVLKFEDGIWKPWKLFKKHKINGHLSLLHMNDSTVYMSLNDKNVRLLLSSMGKNTLNWDTLAVKTNNFIYNIVQFEDRVDCYSYEKVPGEIKLEKLINRKWRKVSKKKLKIYGTFYDPKFTYGDSTVFCTILFNKRYIFNDKICLFQLKNKKWKYLGVVGTQNAKQKIFEYNSYESFIYNNKYYFIYVDPTDLDSLIIKSTNI